MSQAPAPGAPARGQAPEAALASNGPGGSIVDPRLWLGSRFVLAVLTAGALAGLAAIAFYASLNLVQFLFWGDGSRAEGAGGIAWWGQFPTDHVPTLIEIAAGASWLRRLVLPAAGGAIVGALALLLRGERRHGVSELLEAVGYGRRPTRAVNVARRVLSAIVTMASGGSAGQEGPIVQLGGSLAAATSRLFRLGDREQRTLVACGIASGVAAAFNTPLGGALFAIEVAIGATSFDLVWPVLLASVAAQATSRLYLGAGPLYSMSLWTFHAAPARALPLCAMLGVLGGLTGGFFAVGIERTSDAAGRLPLPRWMLPALGGLAVGGAGVVYSQILGNGYPFIVSVTSGDAYPVKVLLLLVTVKMVATCLTLGSGGGGGIFTPALFMGACLGGGFGWAVHAVFPGITTTPAEFAVVGMAAVFVGTFHAPLTAIVIHLEMTRDMDASLALIVACLVAQAATRLVSSESIYHHELTRRGISWSFEPRRRALRDRRVGDIARRRAEAALLPLAGLSEITSAFARSRELRLYVAGERLEGAIDLHDVKTFLGQEGLTTPIIAAEIARPIVPLDAKDSLEIALMRLEQDPIGELPVCDRPGGRFLGVITRADVEASVRSGVSP